MRNFLLWFVVTSLILFDPLFFVSYSVSIDRIAILLLFLYALFFARNASPIARSSIKVYGILISLLLFQFLVDLTIHLQDEIQPIKQLAIELTSVSLLFSIERTKDREGTFSTLTLIAVFIACLFAIVQLANPNFDWSHIIPSNPILLVEEHRFDSFVVATGRLTGPFTIAIKLALFIGCAICLVWGRWILTRKHVFWGGVFILFLFAVGVLSQTRSLIYGLPPSLILGYILGTRGLARKVLWGGTGVAVCLFAFSAYQAFITEYADRAAFGVDSPTYLKLSANVYGLYGALHRDPFFGVPVQRDLDTVGANRQFIALIREGQRALGSFMKVDPSFQTGATNHNMPAFYLKYYGILGFALLIALLFVIYRKIQAKTDEHWRISLLSLYIFVLQFSLLHNTMITQFPLLWGLLPYGEEIANRIRSHGRIQRRENYFVSS